MTGLVGFASGYKAMKSCDTLLDSRRGFSLPAILSRRRQDRADRSPSRGARQSLSARARRVGIGQADAARAAAARSAKNGSTLSRSALADYKSARSGASTRSPKSNAEQHHDPSAICDAAGQRARGGRRNFHLRRRHADRLDGALSQGQRQTPAGRVVQPRLDGECDAACHRCAGGVSQAPGHIVFRRRRLHHDDGRFHLACRNWACRSKSFFSTTARSALSNWR